METDNFLRVVDQNGQGERQGGGRRAKYGVKPLDAVTRGKAVQGPKPKVQRGNFRLGDWAKERGECVGAWVEELYHGTR